MTWHRDAERFAAVRDALATVVADFDGWPVSEIRAMLRTRITAAIGTQVLSDSELSDAATGISNGRKVWLDDSGAIATDEWALSTEETPRLS